MKEEYTRFIDNTKIWVLSGVALAMIIIPTTIISTVNTPNAKTLEVLVFSILMIIIIILSKALQHASFEADDTQVTFSYFGKYTVISYDEIENLLTERRHNELRTKSGIQRCYVDTLKIITSDGDTYCFSAKMDIDYDKIAMNPAYLNEQFENSQFSRLKHYIEDNLDTNKKISRLKSYVEEHTK
ncbi:MAG: hypothetical protein K6F71_08840 [Ruminococcus sp.]|uniref:hypothetical protein n=1 Tax=Ruminococcus sp. TaxID=41978 RepID=UPI0025F3FA7A|nr:hypothetical protein [Ruminococcus sp.]MCR5540902.1 hypothetical protein [Ruminococcus sp.]